MKTEQAITYLKELNEEFKKLGFNRQLTLAIDCVVEHFTDADKIDDAFRNPTWKDELINKAVNWISANACKYVKMNKELIWTSADLNDDFRKFLTKTVTNCNGLGWHKVADGDLPKVNKYSKCVKVFVRKGDDVYVAFYSPTAGFSLSSSFYVEYMLFDVDFWMSIPELPKED